MNDDPNSNLNPSEMSEIEFDSFINDPQRDLRQLLMFSLRQGREFGKRLRLGDARFNALGSRVEVTEFTLSTFPCLQNDPGADGKPVCQYVAAVTKANAEHHEDARSFRISRKQAMLGALIALGVFIVQGLAQKYMFGG